MLALVGQYAGASDLVVTAAVNAEVPDEAPTITSPTNNAVINTSQVTVSGTCPVVSPAVIIAIYEKDTLIGSSTCGDSGTFSVDITRAIGRHVIVATVITVTNQVGESSQPVAIIIRPRPLMIGGEAISPSYQTLAQSIVVNARDIFLVQKFDGSVAWRGNFRGGTPPYKVVIDWGDEEKDTYTVKDSSEQTFEHRYETLRVYSISLRITDSRGSSIVFSSSAVTLAVQQVGAIDSKSLQLPTMTLSTVGQYAVSTYIVTLSGLTFLWYLQHGHVMVTSIIRPKNINHYRRKHRK